MRFVASAIRFAAPPTMLQRSDARRFLIFPRAQDANCAAQNIFRFGRAVVDSGAALARRRRARHDGPRIAKGKAMINIVGAILSGLVIGALARFFYPGDVQMDWLWTIGLGIAGSLLAGLLTSRGASGFHRAGCLASILGAMALIFIGRMLGWGM
jgi:uncharacterized membrane protein YeaQ/YmgE (transglycosylase-associated protein family)